MKIILNKETKIAFVFAIIYSGIGIYEIFSNGVLSKNFDNIYDNLDLYIIFPSHVFGSLIYWILSGFYKTNLWLLLGQAIGLFVYYYLFYSIIIIGTTIKRLFAEGCKRQP